MLLLAAAAPAPLFGVSMLPAAAMTAVLALPVTTCGVVQPAYAMQVCSCSDLWLFLQLSLHLCVGRLCSKHTACKSATQHKLGTFPLICHLV
jgi:hypothetical protein